MTNHRCLHPVKKGLLVIEVIGTVCGRPVCGPCNFKHGNEAVFRCPVHSISDVSSSDESSLYKSRWNCGNKENDRPNKEKVAVVSQKSKHKEKVAKEVIDINGQESEVGVKESKKTSAKNTKGTKYNAKDLLVLSQAFIKTSENAIDGAAQKQNKFWNEVADCFNQLKKQQEAYDSHQNKRQKMNAVWLRGDFYSSDKEDEVEVIITVRTTSSLQQKWSKFVLPYVSKFIALTNTHPKGSGEGEFASFVLLVCNVYLYDLTLFHFFTQIEKDIITESIYSFWNKTVVLILLIFTGRHGST